jgi:hypothetical protein
MNSSKLQWDEYESSTVAGNRELDRKYVDKFQTGQRGEGEITSRYERLMKVA